MPARHPRHLRHRRHATGAVAFRLAAAACALGLLGGAAAGCAVVKKVHTIQQNEAAIKAFTRDLKSTKSVPFQVTYVTTGGSPATVVYAVRPPKDLSFSESAPGTGAGATKLIANSSGGYSCRQTAPGSHWTCTKLAKAAAIAQSKIFAIYTPTHWAAFLHLFAIGAGIAGDKVTTSSKNVNGFALSCVDLFAKSNGTSTICTTKQNLLGYVKVAAQSTAFEIKSYTSSPPASAFQLPAGAKIIHG